MDPESSGWWHRHGWTIALLLTAFGLAFLIRTVFAYPVIAQWGPLFTYAGGSDSYYHSRVMAYIITTHQNLIHDPMLRFPVGSTNPREPLFDWMNAVLGIVFAPFFGGNAIVAGAWFLDLQAPLWSALSVFPIYLIGREVSGRRTGLIAALIFPFLSASIDSSIFGYANYLSFYTCLILILVYSFLRTVKAAGTRRWVESYRDPKQYVPALRAFFRTERAAVKWAVFTGVCLGALALAWQGYTYGVVVIIFSVVILLLVERIRHVDSFGLYIATWIIGLVGLPMEMPYYLTQYGSLTASGFTTFFVLQAILFFGVLLLLLPFLLLRDVPWVFSIPLMGGLIAAGAGGLAVLRPSLFQIIVTGQGYFVKNLIYSTVAEAQAPSIDQLIIGYGVLTFFLAFVGVALFVYLLIRQRFRRAHVVFLVFAVLSIYLPISAAKFFLLGSPAFALLPAEAIRRALELGGYPELRRNVSQLSDRRGQFAAFRKAFKVRHVVILALVVGLILPNIWISIDAGIPGNSKQQFAEQVVQTIPPWLNLNRSAPASSYFGAAGTTLDTPNQYDSAGYNWLAQQDTNVPPADRPAFISWWDYGFQAIAQGNHPSVADNFQNGIDPAGQFLLSQNESQAIAVLAVTLLQAEERASHLPYLPATLNERLTLDGLNVTELHTLLVNTSRDYTLVVNNPAKYLPVNPDTLTLDNAMYLATTGYIASALPLSGVANVYDDLQLYTGWSIRYAMADTRLFPFSGTNTGIFYAPADLTGRIIDQAGLPSTFFNVTVLGSDGNVYPAGQLPAGVGAVQYYINYFAPFYRSMIYHIYIGYNGTEVGQANGIPGLLGDGVSDPIEPGWMLQHFMVVYQTAYYCPGQRNATSGASCFMAANKPTAQALAHSTNGTVDTSALAYFQGGESMLAYYPGETLLGSLTLPDGTPVPGVRVTVDDQWGIPHMTTLTGSDGSFSIVLPPGNDTLNFTAGTLQGRTQQDNIVLKTVSLSVPSAIGYNPQTLPVSEGFTLQPSSVAGYVYWNTANNSSYVHSVDAVIPGAHVVLWGPNNTTRLTTVVDNGGSFEITNVPPGVYHAAVLYGAHNFTALDVIATPGTTVNASTGLSPGQLSGTVLGPDGSPYSLALVSVGNANGTVATAESNFTGAYTVTNLGPGNYTVTASVPGTTYRSAGLPTSISTPGAHVVLNLTMASRTVVTYSVQANGQPVANLPVRFVPVATFENGSAAPVGEVEASLSNATLATSDARGSVSVALPAGQYAVYAAGYVGSQLYAGLSEVTTPSGLSPVVPTLTLSPALSLSGTIPSVGSSSANHSVVIAYASSGGVAAAIASSSGAFSLLLPAGTYSLLALQGSATASLTVYAAVASVTLSASTRVTLDPSSAVATRFTVGTVLPNGKFFAAGNATVTISAGPTGPSLSLVADANGSVAAYLPSILPLSAPSYCISASAVGFSPSTTCGISPYGLSVMTTFDLTLRAVPVDLTVVGLPSGTPIRVNFTAESPTAVSRNLTGGPTFSLSLPPGVYGVGAWAVIGNGTRVYLPATILNTTIPFGAVHTTLTLIVIAQVNSTGKLSLPAAVAAANVTVALSSPLLFVSVNGTAYTKGFHAAPGTYTASVKATAGSLVYENLTRVTVSASGVISPTLVLNRAGVSVTGTLTDPKGTALSINTTVTFVGPGPTRVISNAVAGTFSAVLPPNSTFQEFANATGSSTGPNGSYFVQWSGEAGQTCVVGNSASQCALAMRGVPVGVWLNGSLTSPGVPGNVSGTVRLLGPYPSNNVTTVSAANGSFSVLLSPGAYSVYASGGGGSEPLAGFSSVLALPSAAGPVSFVLSPTWIDTISVAAPNATGATAGPATVVVTDPFGQRVLFAQVSPGSSVPVALPLGTYSVTAQANGTLNGIASVATARTTVVVAHGNLGTVLYLTVPAVSAVTGSLVGPTGATVTAGGVVTFSFSVRDVGNVPVSVTPVGSPKFWSFNFTTTSYNLTPGGPSASGEVRIGVPTGTDVDHGSVLLQFALSNGTVVGAVVPGPRVNVVGYYGVAVGSTATAPTVGAEAVVVPFYVADTGNQGETVRLTVADAARLAALGWNATLEGAAGGYLTVAMSAGANLSEHANLTALTSAFAAPLSITVAATVLNASGAVQSSTTLAVPLAVVKLPSTNGQNPLKLTGPSIAAPSAPLPVWLVPLLSFVPAIALAVVIVTYRWWRTRRWTRR